MAQIHFRVALGIVLALSVPSVARAHATRDAEYRAIVNRYADGAHAASVIDVLALPVADVITSARDALREQSRLYERGRDRASSDGRLPRDVAVNFLHYLRAAAALHLEAAIAAPPNRVSTRHQHIAVAEAALRELDGSQSARWKRDSHVTEADRAAIAGFRHDWWLIAATHFQRTIEFYDALRFTNDALREFEDRAVFHVIKGSIYEALAAPVATFDGQRASVGLSRDPDEAVREALQRAGRSFERALVLRPDDAEARVRLASVQVRLGAFEAAQRHLVDEAPPGRLAYLLALVRGQLAEAQGRYGVALDRYREAVSASDRWQAACFALSHTLVRLGRHDEARGALRGCLAREAESTDPWHAYAMGLEWLVDPTVRQLRAGVGGAAGVPRD